MKYVIYIRLFFYICIEKVSYRHKGLSLSFDVLFNSPIY